MNSISFQYIGSNNKVASADCHFEDSNLKTIVFCHGFKSFKDWGHFNLIAQWLCTNGFNVIKFNYTHNGTSLEHPTDFVDLESFGNNNFEKELFDLEALLNYLPQSEAKAYYFPDNTYLMGHSKGGATALAYFLDNKTIKKSALLAPVIHVVDRYGNVTDEEWKNTGVKMIPNARTNQMMPLYYQLALNTVKIKNRFDFINLLKEDKRQILIAHGTEDESVTINESLSLKNLQNVSIKKIAGANHTFGGKHPYGEKNLPQKTIEALREIVEFLK